MPVENGAVELAAGNNTILTLFSLNVNQKEASEPARQLCLLRLARLAGAPFSPSGFQIFRFRGNRCDLKGLRTPTVAARRLGSSVLTITLNYATIAAGVAKVKKFAVLIVCLVLAGALALGWFLFGGRLLAWYYDSGASSALAEGRTGQAASLLERQLELSPLDEELRLRVVQAYIDDDNYSRAEYHLAAGLRNTVPSAAFYAGLCSVYAAQDKLPDAVELLGGITDAGILAEIAAMRPDAPVFSVPPGKYSQALEISLSAPEGCAVYVSWDGDIPSVKKDAYTQPVRLGKAGTVSALAVCVSADGLVSVWSQAEYVLENIVEPLSFTDTAIETLVRTAIGKPSGTLYSSDLWGITALSSETPAQYTTLADLAACTGLKTLELTGMDSPCDISGLASLELVNLSLRSFGIDSVDLDALSGMTSLEKLELTGNRISGIDRLSALTGLVELSLSENNLLEIDSLSALTGLKKLDISRGAVQDLRPLLPLRLLEELNVSYNRVETLAGLESAAELRLLDASNNYVDTIAPVSKLAKVEELLLGHNALAEIPALRGMKALKTLDLSVNKLESLAALEDLTSIEILYASENSIASLAGLEGLTALRELDASKNLVNSVEALSGLPALVTVRVERNRLGTLLPLKSCPSLKTVYAFGNELLDALDAFSGTGITVNRS